MQVWHCQTGKNYSSRFGLRRFKGEISDFLTKCRSGREFRQRAGGQNRRLPTARRHVDLKPQRHSCVSLAVTVRPFRSSPGGGANFHRRERDCSRQGVGGFRSLRQGRGRTRGRSPIPRLEKRVAARAAELGTCALARLRLGEVTTKRALRPREPGRPPRPAPTRERRLFELPQSLQPFRSPHYLIRSKRGAWTGHVVH